MQDMLYLISDRDWVIDKTFLSLKLRAMIFYLAKNRDFVNNVFKKQLFLNFQKINKN
jgi:hypothetical protein